MNKERLQEIKDSIELQYALAKAKNYDNALLFTNEEEELIEEIERLNNIINKTSKKLEMTLNCIKDYMVENEEYIKIHTDYIYALEEQINKLKGSEKE